MTIDIDAIRQRAEAATPGPWTTGSGEAWSDALAPWALVINANYPLIELQEGAQGVADAEFIAHARTDVPALLAKLAKPCGSCHPCTNYRDETWRAANRKPPHVIEWDDAQAELKALRAVAEAAKAWVKFEGITEQNNLTAAVDALPNPAEHLDICPGYGCPGCREQGVA